MSGDYRQGTGKEKKKKNGSRHVVTARKRRSPAALVVEEEHEVELLLRLVLHLLADAQHVHRGHGDGHAVVLAAHPRHVGVDDLQTAGVGNALSVTML